MVAKVAKQDIASAFFSTIRNIRLNQSYSI